MTYAEQLKHPLWQKKRLEVLSRENFTCQDCGNTKITLHVHHRYYVSNRYAWEYPDFCYKVLCKNCHDMLKTYSEEQRSENGVPVPDLWECGLNYFGDSVFDLIEANEHGVLPRDYRRAK